MSPLVFLSVMLLIGGCEKRTSDQQSESPKSAGSSNVFPGTISVPGGKFTTTTDNFLAPGQGHWRPAFAPVAITIQTEQLVSDSLFVLQLLTDVIFDEETTVLALKATAFQIMSSQQSKQLLTRFPKLQAFRIVTRIQKNEITPEQRDQFGNITQSFSQHQVTKHVATYEIDRRTLQKLNVEYFSRTDDQVRTTAEVQTYGSPVDRSILLEEKPWSAQMFSAAMYKAYCEPLIPLIKEVWD